MSDAATSAMLPLLVQFPALAALPRVLLGRFPTPVDDASILHEDLWIKRDDLTAAPVGGSKVRALEFLLGDLPVPATVLTVGAEASTHALATAVHGRSLGARVIVDRWPQEMDDGARVIASRVREAADLAPIHASVLHAYAAAAWRRFRSHPRWVPAGGSSALGVLGHVSAALELAAQIRAGELPAPNRVVVPLGSGGTAAGLWLGFQFAGIETTIVAARVVPRIVANKGHVLRLALGARRLLTRLTGARIPRPRRDRLVIAHEAFGGAYGRPSALGAAAAARHHGLRHAPLDATYSAKALAVALARSEGGPTLYWLTFDPRMLTFTPNRAE